MYTMTQYPMNTLAIDDDTNALDERSYSSTNTSALVSVDDIARFFSVHVRTAQRWTKLHQIPCYRIGGIVRYDLDEVRRRAGQHRE